MDLNKLLSVTLRAGVLAGAFLSLLGLAIWATHGFRGADFTATPDVYGAIGSVVAGNPTGIIYLGVIVLIATPVLRVAISIAYFGAERDAKYLGITVLVFAMLLYALLSGKAS